MEREEENQEKRSAEEGEKDFCRKAITLNVRYIDDGLVCNKVKKQEDRK